VGDSKELSFQTAKEASQLNLLIYVLSKPNLQVLLVFVNSAKL